MTLTYRYNLKRRYSVSRSIIVHFWPTVWQTFISLFCVTNCDFENMNQFMRVFYLRDSHYQSKSILHWQIQNHILYLKLFLSWVIEKILFLHFISSHLCICGISYLGIILTKISFTIDLFPYHRNRFFLNISTDEWNLNKAKNQLNFCYQFWPVFFR